MNMNKEEIVLNKVLISLDEFADEKVSWDYFQLGHHEAKLLIDYIRELELEVGEL